MHCLNELYSQYSNVEYRTSEDGTTWFDFSKTIKNNILVELNINALNEIYNLNP